MGVGLVGIGSCVFHHDACVVRHPLAYEALDG